MEKNYKELTEDYIWAIRSSFQQDSDSELWKERRATPLLNTSTDTVARRKRRSSRNVDPTADDYNVRVMASLVPDEIIYNVNDYSIKSYDACFLFGDVSGFTDLCEKYNKTGKGGPSRLTQVLNSYIGSMVQEILSHSGDVFKFSGDAFLAMWKSGSSGSMQDAVHEALDTALVIQKTYGTYETDVGVFLRVKLAISAGFVKFSLIGTQHNSHYIVIGQPIYDVKAAEHISVAGEIIVSVNAWHYVNPNEYLYEVLPDGLHVKIHGLGPNWRNTQRHIRYQKSTNEEEEELDALSQDDTDSESDSALDAASDSKKQDNDDFLIRPAVNVAARMNIKEDLRKFIIGPVMRGIDLDEPLEYLTEMRQTVILFINVTTQKIDMDTMIRLVNRAYIDVCSVVDDMRGCVNKVSIFDKDLMFVVIFGLRGFKHELESQIGLRCAVECRQLISVIENVKTTSIGVTTGMCYCGVVGHTLRREYTVISITVNKAARLMVAYPDKVVCDRETFLHSKLEARNFILQEHKELKGITNPGPVYEFKEETMIQEKTLYINRFPLLGRHCEISIYKKILNEYIEESKRKSKQNIRRSMLLIRGDARQGKTRLLSEMVYVTQKEIPINRFFLTNRDNKVPFQTIQMIFSKALGLSELSSERDRQRKLIKRLGKLDVPEILCALNPVFSVHFDQSMYFMKLSPERKQVVLRKLIKQLCQACFHAFWVITIDDGEFTDDESWGLLPVILELNVILIVMTMGSRRILGPLAEKTLQHRKIETINLAPIDKWYHAGLACQTLDVTAIPPELERVIQSRSNGNPGWVESFLVSLTQAGGLVVRTVTKMDVIELGLVAPPLSMMQRSHEEEIDDSESCSLYSEAKDFGKDAENLHEGWKMYQYCYKDSTTRIMENMYKDQGTDKVSVCTIAPNFNIEDVDPELSADVLMLKIFDSLTSFEQLLLKCSSIIGEFFPRDMLSYLIGNAPQRTISIAIQKLFEIRVLGCAKGDFTQGDIGMVFKQRLINPNLDTDIKCECRGVKIHESCTDLPKYAYCGYIRFRMPMFRETTYNLLTDNQKKEFHNKAIRYLEKETRRCRSCGNGFFVRILGAKHDVGLKRKLRTKRTSIMPSRSQSKDELDSTRQSIDVSGSTTGSRRASATGSIASRSQRAVSITGDSVATMISVRLAQTDMVPSGCLGISTIRKTRRGASITRTFSAADFSSCQCPQILTTMYSQMLEHCEGAGQMEKMMEAMLEYSYVCIITCNIPQAMKILEEALKILEITPVENETETAWKFPLIRGKLETLQGQCYLELGQLDEAFYCFHSAMRCYGYPFPTSSYKIRSKVFLKELKQNFGLFLFPSILSKRMENYEAEFCDNLSECLTLMCTLFMEINAWREAELAAVWSLNKSLASESDFYCICNAYANMLQVMHHSGRQKTCIALEVHALRLCHRKTSSIEAQELKAVARLYTAIFCSRLLRSEIDHAISIAFITLHICSSIHAIQLILHVYPLLLHALLMKCRITDVVSILHEIEYYAEEDIDNSGRTWYFSLCVILQLETGYTLIPFKFCEKFYQIHAGNILTVRDPDAERCFYVVMWLWCVRNEDFDGATIWLTNAGDFSLVSADDSLTNVFTTLYLLEGMLLYIVCRIDQRNVRSVANAYKEVASLIASLEKIAQKVKIILPRLWHLKAYFRFVKYADNTTFTILNTARKYATNFQNYLELAWIDHSEKAWSNNLPSISVDFWKEHCEPDNLLDYHEVDMNDGKLGQFTLPTPLYSI